MAGRTQQATRRRKRTQTPVYSSIAGSYEDKDNDFVCPVCFDIIDEAHMTKCGHTFCYKCIKNCLEKTNRCPKCNYIIESADHTYPNFTLNELILKYRGKQDEKRIKTEQAASPGPADLLDIITEDTLDLANVNHLLEVLANKKQQLEADGKLAENCILKEFLQQVKQRKQEHLEQLTREIALLDEDTSRIDNIITEHQQKNTVSPDHLVPSGFDVRPSISEITSQDGFNGSKNSGRLWTQSSMGSRRKKISQHFEDLEQCYFSTRLKHMATGDESSDGLMEFTESLSKFTKFSSFRPLATLSYAVDLFSGGSSIVSSIEFDRDCDYFAIAGVTKKIKVYEYGTVIKDAVDIHYPVIEMVCNSKISCVTWSAYHKSMLASSDYEGTVTLWDAFTGVKSKIFQEHEKRCWSVDFNKMDPKLLASGSDDAKVKLWSTNAEHSIANLEAKANVCCVKFNPDSRYHLAFGSADHCVHYYDLRSTKQPVGVFRGHRKAVSYAKFVDSVELVSASTDSQLKLWSIGKPNCVRTFKGHTNEKNFVGLATDGDYVACGSENNSLYVYYKGLSKQLMTYKFDTVRSVLEKDRKDEDANEFVSAVTWRPGSNVIVAANSQGTVKVLELV
ncbi:E3 ubiquitin-protein ligase COP1-like isoform X2 [Gigantopelta aegis]|uniref:E3 ubiquitin-protein ligase COP1-like isoform X2 n=1 Tax=Gigantopelta aegis TaxID=1735272 RepID=UPI001B88C2BC|nr:E3 ubiquitin-protein ligase COP1-like isoform X2 [Gigantopelta aegis]